MAWLNGQPQWPDPEAGPDGLAQWPAWMAWLGSHTSGELVPDPPATPEQFEGNRAHQQCKSQRHSEIG